MDNLYKERILDLYKHPRNKGIIEGGRVEKVVNPLCGDVITMSLSMKGGRVEDAKFDGFSCALCNASASLLTEEVKGISSEKILEMGLEDIERMLKIKVSPNRLKCVLLPLEALQKLIRSVEVNEEEDGELLEEAKAKEKYSVEKLVERGLEEEKKKSKMEDREKVMGENNA